MHCDCECVCLRVLWQWVCVTMEVGGRKYFDLHFSCLVCILFPSGNNLLMRQAGHSQKRMLTMRLHMNTHMLFALFCVECTRTGTHTQLRRDTHIYHTGRDTLQLSLHASLRLFMTSRDSKVNQLFFDWFDLVLTVCSHAYVAAVKSSNGLHFMQQECQTQLSVSTPFSPSSLLFVFTCPPPALQLCRSDGWYINGTCAE